LTRCFSSDLHVQPIIMSLTPPTHLLTKHFQLAEHIYVTVIAEKHKGILFLYAIIQNRNIAENATLYYRPVTLQFLDKLL
jgi:hypothetical protein